MASVHFSVSNMCVLCLPVLAPAGYGFVDFDSPASAQKAVTALKAGGVQAQMAKVRTGMFPSKWSCVSPLRNGNYSVLARTE